MCNITFIRHAEKNDNDPIHLSESGIIRANELVNFFIEKKRDIPLPTKIIAMKQKNKKSSNRPYETIYPLAQKLNLEINTDLKKKEIKKIVDYIIENENENILVCWEHEYLVEIIKQLTRIHLKWKSDDYSSVYVWDDKQLKYYKQ